MKVWKLPIGGHPVITLMPCILDMALRGLRALKVLMVLKAWMPPMPRRDALKLISDTLKNKENDHELVLKIQPYHPRRQNQEKGKLLEEKRGTLYQKGKIS